MYGLSAATTYVLITLVGGFWSFLAAVILACLYYSGMYVPRSPGTSTKHVLQLARFMDRLLETCVV